MTMHECNMKPVLINFVTQTGSCHPIQRNQSSCFPWLIVALLLIISWQPQRVLASSGDRAWAFQACLERCLGHDCPLFSTHASQLSSTGCPKTCSQRDFDVNATPEPVPLALRVFRWSCEADCKYHCMHTVETRKLSVGIPNKEKYFGKWPFVRVLGMQELVSVLASLTNLIVHAVYLSRFRVYAQKHVVRTIYETGPPFDYRQGTPAVFPLSHWYPFLRLWTTHGLLHMNAWLWSAVFHCRDTRLTERLDYVSAASLLSFGLFAVLVRAIWGPRRWQRLAVAIVGGVIITALGAHVYYMLFIKFDYDWNMRVCVGVGLETAVVWLGWCCWTQHPARRRMYAFLLLMHLAMLLELLDFPPLAGLLDAHATWHIATAALTPLFYSWLQEDVAVAVDLRKNI